MEFEQFKEFMLQSAAQHDVRIAQIEEALRSLANTTQRLVDNQVYLQEKVDTTQGQLQELGLEVKELGREVKELSREVKEIGREIKELGRIVFRHVTDPSAHQPARPQ